MAIIPIGNLLHKFMTLVLKIHSYRIHDNTLEKNVKKLKNIIAIILTIFLIFSNTISITRGFYTAKDILMNFLGIGYTDIFLYVMVLINIISEILIIYFKHELKTDVKVEKIMHNFFKDKKSVQKYLNMYVDKSPKKYIKMLQLFQIGYLIFSLIVFIIRSINKRKKKDVSLVVKESLNQNLNKLLFHKKILFDIENKNITQTLLEDVKKIDRNILIQFKDIYNIEPLLKSDDEIEKYLNSLSK